MKKRKTKPKQKKEEKQNKTKQKKREKKNNKPQGASSSFEWFPAWKSPWERSVRPALVFYIVNRDVISP